MPALLKTTQIQEPSSSTINVTLPAAGGGVTINGTTSGGVTVVTPAVAGSNTVTLPAATGTALVSSTAISTAISGTPSASTYLRGDGTWSGVSATGQLIRAPQILTSGTSYTTPSNCTAIYLEMWGAGGSGATWNTSGGGGSGAYLAKYATVTGSTAYTYSIGSGGAARSSANQNGASGGNTTFTIGATTYTAGGGGGGSGGNSNPQTGANGGSGGTATNGDINLFGMAGNTAFYPGASTTTSEDYPLGSRFTNQTFHAGAGGCTVGPLFTMSGGAAGQAGQYYGAGGGGLGSGPSGAGFQGLIRIWEFT